jgi:hypothetical protein
LAALDGHGGVERVMALAWRGSGLIHVERRPPLATATGKILHLHTSSARDPSRVADDRMSRVGSQQAHRR